MRPDRPKEPQPCEEPFTSAQLEKAVEFVMYWGQRRFEQFGKAFNECDYLSGAMAVFFAMSEDANIPPMWVLGPLSGRKLFTKDASK